MGSVVQVEMRDVDEQIAETLSGPTRIRRRAWRRLSFSSRVKEEWRKEAWGGRAFIHNLVFGYMASYSQCRLM